MQNNNDSSKRKNTFRELLFVFWLAHWFFYLWMDRNDLIVFRAFVLHTFQYLVPVLASYGLKYFYKKHSVHQLPFVKIYLIVLGLSTVCAFSSILYYHLLHFFLFSHIHFNGSLIEVVKYVYTFIILSAIYIGYKYYQDFLLQKEKAEHAILHAQKSQLEMLRYQINPHFLFNTLNSARSLVLANPPLARDLLTQISQFLRYTLSEGNKTTVTLLKEVEATNTYIEIEKIRFQSNLITECSIDPQTEDFEIPVFLILPLVENAIKHGMRTTTLPLKIKIKAKVVAESVQIEISNTGQWIDHPSNEYNSGTGLKNVEKRLENTYPGVYFFEIIKLDNIVKVIIKIKK